MRRIFVACKQSRWIRRPGWIVLALSLSAAIAGALVPSSVMGWLRTVVPGFATMWDWLDASLPWLNPLHVIVYAWVAGLWRTLLPGGSLWRMPLALTAIGAACEVLQNFVPNRTPRVSDVGSDMLGIVIGLGLAVMAHRLLRPSRASDGELPLRSVRHEGG